MSGSVLPVVLQVYITMERNEKTEGKAAVDLLGSYFGKSGASMLTQVWGDTCNCLSGSYPS